MNKAIDPELQQKIIQWKKDLAELGKRNRLLHFQKDKKSTTEIPIPAAKIFEKLVLEEQPISLNDLLDDDIDNRKINNNLTKLHKDARDIFEQKGVNVLFLALGTLKWNSKEKPREDIISPIILIPVELDKPPRKREYSILSTDESIFINPALALKLNNDYGIILNEEINTDEDLDYQKLLDRVSQNKDISKRINNSNWEIEETTYLGLFERKKVSMIKDLEYLQQEVDGSINNPILLGLANNRKLYESSTPEIIPVENLDDCILPSSVLQVLEADSSQQQVIEAAISGMSFIVQGPPGTGKSQTIVNLIAELIGQNKKVLVVAEKPVALQVVFDRLNKSGLEEAIINFSNQDIGKKKNFAKYLKNYRKDSEHTYEEFDLNYIFYELTNSRQILNQHSKILHKKWRPIEKSTFELYGELLKLQRECNYEIRFTFRNINKWSYIQLARAKNLIDKLIEFHPFIKCQQKTVWQQSNLTALNSQKREQIYEGIEKLSQHIKWVRETGNELAILVSQQTPQTLEELENIVNAGHHIANFPLDKRRVREQGEFENVFVQATGFINIPKVPKFWMSNTNIKLLWRLLSELENDCNLEQEYSNDLVSEYESSFFSQNLHKILSICRGWGIFRWFSSKYWKDKHKILKDRKSKRYCSDKRLIKDVEKAVKLHNIKSNLADNNYQPRLAFETFFIRDKPDLFSIKLALIWFDELLKYKLSKKSISELIYSENSRRELVNALDKLNWQKNFKEINNEFNILKDYFDYPEKIINGSNRYFQNIPINEIERFLEKAANELDIFRKWLDYQENIKQLKGMGLESFLDKIKECDASPNVWSTVFEKSFYYYWLQYIYDNSTELRCFNFKIHEDTITKFSQQDEKRYEFARVRLQKLYAEQRDNWFQEKDVKPTISYFEQETQKQRKHDEIRQFIHKACDLVLALKPCWLMSPLMVSEYIPPELIPFDVVIFDEASQIRTEDAISSIMRAKQVIVVGDTQQMPPSSFFSGISSEDDDDENQDEAAYESFLAECGKFMQEFTLKWHYRSQDESLIDFSNKRFYESKLVTFPSPVKDKNRGVFFHHVRDGVYERGGKGHNIRETEEVAQLALDHVRQNMNLSLGIIAFSKKQASAIQKKIEELSQNNDELAEFSQDDSDKIFVRNLENVQGDEADVIILSFGYGRDKEGKFERKFGPINYPGGERRLNVAITRAKHKLILVASITPDMLSGVYSQGVICFKEYFEYIQRVERERIEETNSRIYNSNSLLIEDIAYALQKEGYEVETSLGASNYPIDLAVKNKQQANEFLLGIECDGLTYNKYPTARDRDRLRRIVLEKMNWQIHRIWSKHWYHNRQVQINLLLELLKQLEVQKEI
ncbi:DUF4011 domain-containing protein [Calothrix sp. CCY 0018]|uniref:DUF4011 domain-containing protein n=1 Tax=Calothrix sp. CCY 0018 TaxID=3103864 RepID=UPI0039C6B494